jgi:hypothetical protein
MINYANVVLSWSRYLTSNVSILMRELGKAPATNGTYTMRNRLIGQVAAKPIEKTIEDTIEEPVERSIQEASPGGAVGSGFVIEYLSRSDQVNTISATAAYSLGGVVFSPNVSPDAAATS